VLLYVDVSKDCGRGGVAIPLRFKPFTNYPLYGLDMDGFVKISIQVHTERTAENGTIHISIQQNIENKF
jgi:hypothetical protein